MCMVLVFGMRGRIACGRSSWRPPVRRRSLLAAMKWSPWGAVAIVAATLIFPLSAQAQQTAGPSIEGPPLDIVMLVDESGSLSGADVAREIQAAGTIAQTPLNPRSRVTVVGFGGVNQVAPNQDPTTVVCQPTVTGSTVALEYLARCVSGLHRRTEAEGDDTDYAAALAQAMNYLGSETPDSRQSPAGATKAIFLMTDGGLDVHRDPQYLPDWLPAAHHAVDLQLAAARAANVQIWPLGYGTISSSDQQYLRYLAASGAQNGCDSRTVSRPHAVIAQDSGSALNDLYALYASAGCLGVSQGSSGMLGAGQTRTLEVTIPAIASYGAISVDKGNPAIGVDYVAPDGQRVTGGTLGGSTFQRSGQDTAVDVLHVTDPAPGTWRVRLTAPAGLGQQLVSAAAFWQGAVRAIITASPPSARVGQPIKVTLSVLGPDGPITDPATLKQIQVGVSVTGDGLPASVSVPVSNSGEGQATATGVGDYNGTFTAPDRRGPLEFTGTAQGYGLYPTRVPTTVQVGAPSSLLQAVVEFSAPASVLPGQSVTGQILFSNQTGAAQRVRVALSASPAYATITSPDNTVQVPSGNSPASFRIAFAPNSPRGNMLLRVSVVDAANPDTVYGNGQLTITVSNPPGLFARYAWEIAGGIILVLLVLAIATSRRRQHRKDADVRGLSAMLRHDDGSPACAALKPPSRRADSFRFVIRDEDLSRPRLVHARSGDRAYVARRAGHGKVRLVTPEGDKSDITVGGSGEPLPDGFHLAFADTRVSARSHTGEDAFGEPGEHRIGGSSFSASSRSATTDRPRPGRVVPTEADASRDSADDWL